MTPRDITTSNLQELIIATFYSRRYDRCYHKPIINMYYKCIIFVWRINLIFA